jgi:hypothetical protein
MIPAILALGAIAVAAGWRLVATKRASIWLVAAVSNGALGAIALATGRVELSPLVQPSKAAIIGALAGVAMYFATVIFVLFVRRWPRFSGDVTALYGEGGGLPLAASLAMACLIAAPGEELFWRGLFQGYLSQTGGRVSAALFAWAGYILANAASASLPIVAGAVVGGAVWGAFALWTGGVLASLLCHAIWTGLMIVLPPPGATAKVPEVTA